MEKTAKQTPNDDTLNERRRRAVELRIDGASLAAITAEVNLSSPTIINAHKAFLDGGWAAVDQRPRGRSSGAVALGGDEQDILAELLESAPESCDPQKPLWNYRLLQQWLTAKTGKKTTLRTATKYAERWQLRGDSALSSNMAASDDEQGTVLSARKRGLAVYSIGLQRLPQHSLLYAHDGRGSFSWMVANSTANVDDISDFLQRLHKLSGKSFFLLVSGIDLARQAALQQWFKQHRCGYLQIQTTSSTKPAATPRQVSDEQMDVDQSIKQRLPAQETNSDTGKTAKQTIAVSVRSGQSDNRQSTTTNQPVNTQELSMTSQSTRLQQKADAETDAASSTTAAKKTNETKQAAQANNAASQNQVLTHLQRLEAESIHILREVIAEADKPVMLHSLGKDSAVMLHLARKAFYPAPLPLPLMHIDTTWKFKAMYQYRDELAADTDCELIVHSNEEGIKQGVNPITHGSSLHTDIMKTQALRQAIEKHGFDVAVAGARRDEEGTRAKERVFSFRSEQHRWDPRNQRPELWNLYNTRKQPGESIRVFPLSNWTELDVWQYILQENIDVVPLYFAAERPVVERDGNLILVNDDRLTLNDGEVPSMREVRFRTLGCYPLTGASESTATTLPEIIAETYLAKTSERSGRMIDHDSAASMEQKKQEGYF